MGNQTLSIRSKNPSMSVVNIRILGLFTRRRVESDALSRDSLPWRQGIRARFEGVSRCHQLFCQLRSPTLH